MGKKRLEFLTTMEKWRRKMSKKKRKEETDGEGEPRQERAGAQRFKIPANTGILGSISNVSGSKTGPSLLSVPGEVHQDGDVVEMARSPQTETETGRPLLLTPQPSGDREQVGQLEPPESPTEGRAKPYVIGFLIYELLIQLPLGLADTRDVKVTY